MTDQTPPTLRSLFDALHAERERTWPQAQLQANIDQRRHLEADSDRSRFVKAGDLVPDFRAPRSEGGEAVLSELLHDGPVALVFFRHAACPACNIALPYYKAHLQPQLTALDIQLVAISPQIPERLAEIKTRHELNFPILNDTDSHLAKTFGIAFEPDAEALARTTATGRGSVRDTTGANNNAFPSPTIIVIDRDRRVVFADVTPDWLARTEPGVVLDALAALQTRVLEPAA